MFVGGTLGSFFFDFYSSILFSSSIFVCFYFFEKVLNFDESLDGDVYSIGHYALIADSSGPAEFSFSSAFCSSYSVYCSGSGGLYARSRSSCVPASSIASIFGSIVVR